MCQWHGLVYSMNIAVSVTQTSLIWWVCVNDTVTYILWISMCQWHRIAYSMNICVSMTQNCTFDECLCVNDTKWDLSTMSKIWPSAILIVCDRLGQPYDVWLVSMVFCYAKISSMRWKTVIKCLQRVMTPLNKIDVPVSCVERCSPQKLIK